MLAEHLERLNLFVPDLGEARSFMSMRSVAGPFRRRDRRRGRDQSGRVVLHRNDRSYDERGIFPAGSGVGGAAVRVVIDDPDACERDALAGGLTVLWPTQ